MQSDRDEFFEHMIRQIRGLPAEQQQEALLHFTSIVLRSLDRTTIAAMRSEIDTALGRTEGGREILQLVDGHLALRELQESGEL